MQNKLCNISNLLQPINPNQQQELDRIKEQFISKTMQIMQNTNQVNAKIDLSQIWQHTEDLPTLYDQLTDLKKSLDSFRPIPVSTIQDMQEQLDIQYTYESNRIEGNSLTLDETLHVIEKGLTIGGKPLADHLEAINHQQAIYYIRDLAKDGKELNQFKLLNIHSLVLKGIRDNDAGRYRSQPVFILKSDGEKYEFPPAYLVSKLMEDYFIFYNENKDNIHPVAMSANLHQKLVNIHPFIDGNGRTSRLVMNLHLLQSGYPITIIDSEMDKRQEYYRILGEYQSSDNADSKPFELFIAQKVKESLFEYLHFLSGDISDESKNKGYYFFKKIQACIS